MRNPVILITAEDIEAMRDRERAIEARIAEDQGRLTEIRDWLRAAALLTASKAIPISASFSGDGRLTANVDATTPHVSRESGTTDNLTEAIERIANTSHAPVTKSNLKTMLAKEGFAGDRLANYFYTAIHRLKAKQRITVTPDGSVWRASEKDQDAGGYSRGKEPHSALGSNLVVAEVGGGT